MKRILIAIALFGGVQAVPASAGPVEDQFLAMDKSRDGSISRSEFVAFQLEQGTSAREANTLFENTSGGDGRINLNELRAGPVANTGPRVRPARQPRTPTRRRSPPRRTGGGGS